MKTRSVDNALRLESFAQNFTGTTFDVGNEFAFPGQLGGLAHSEQHGLQLRRGQEPHRRLWRQRAMNTQRLMGKGWT
jgi:hypothetical protein